MLRLPVLRSGLFRWSWPRHLCVMDSSWTPWNVLCSDARFTVARLLERAAQLLSTRKVVLYEWVVNRYRGRHHLLLGHVDYSGLARLRIHLSVHWGTLLVLTRFPACQVFVVPNRNDRCYIVLLTAAEHRTCRRSAHSFVTLSTIAGNWFRNQVLHFSTRFLGWDRNIFGVFSQWNDSSIAPGSLLLPILLRNLWLWRRIDLSHTLDHCKEFLLVDWLHWRGSDGLHSSSWHLSRILFQHDHRWFGNLCGRGTLPVGFGARARRELWLVSRGRLLVATLFKTVI